MPFSSYLKIKEFPGYYMLIIASVLLGILDQLSKCYLGLHVCLLPAGRRNAARLWLPKINSRSLRRTARFKTAAIEDKSEAHQRLFSGPLRSPCVGLDERRFASRIGRPRGFSHSSGLFGLNLQIVDDVLHPAHFFGSRGGLVFCRGVLNDSGQIDGALYCLDTDP